MALYLCCVCDKQRDSRIQCGRITIRSGPARVVTRSRKAVGCYALLKPFARAAAELEANFLIY